MREGRGAGPSIMNEKYRMNLQLVGGIHIDVTVINFGNDFKKVCHTYLASLTEGSPKAVETSPTVDGFGWDELQGMKGESFETQGLHSIRQGLWKSTLIGQQI